MLLHSALYTHKLLVLVPWHAVYAGIYNAGGIRAGGIWWDVLQTMGTLFVVLWFGWYLWSFSNVLSDLMDRFHPLIPPFRCCQTHCPPWLIQHKYESPSLGRRPPAVCVDADDDIVDKLLKKELEWIYFRQFHWHKDWSLTEAIYRLWLQVVPRITRLGYTTMVCGTSGCGQYSVNG